MNFVVLGGFGYVGGRLVQYLRSQGHRVCVTTRRAPSSVPDWFCADKIVQSDLTRPDELIQCLDGQDGVVHLAAPDEIESAKHPLESLRAGGEKTWCVMEALSRCTHPPVLLYISTIHVYGPNAKGVVHEETLPQPTHPYGLGRYVGECVVQLFRRQKKVQALCVRMSNTFGVPLHVSIPRWSLVFGDLCLQAVLAKKVILKTPGTQRRNFITLHDAVRAMEFLSLRPTQWPKGGIIHLGSSMNLRIQEVAERVAQAAGLVDGERPTLLPPKESHPSGDDLNFSIDRLKALGFQWSNPVEQEVEATLRLCREAEHTWGDSLWKICRPDLVLKENSVPGSP